MQRIRPVPQDERSGSAEHHAAKPKTGSPLERIGNADLVRGIDVGVPVSVATASIQTSLSVIGRSSVFEEGK